MPKFLPRRYYPKSWWSPECSREREKLYRKWKATSRMDDKIKWKRARAIATKIFTEAKRENLRQYLSTMTVNTSAAKIYEKIRRIKGRPPRRINILKKQGTVIAAIPTIANCLAEAFAEISDAGGGTLAFQQLREKEERTPIGFTSNNEEPYNEVFTMEELSSALSRTKDTTPGPDQVHYKMLKYLSQPAKLYLLQMFNKFWIESYFPEQWKNATVIHIAKLNKDHSNPSNYRPIALTSCIC